MNNKSFKRFQEITSDNTTIPLWIQRTVDRFGNYKGTVYDLGCGAGNISLYMAEKGWNVIAVDIETAIIENKKKMLSEILQKNLNIINNSFENIKMQECDFIISIDSLSWCDKEKFNDLWKKINDSLKIGGRIAITLFGENDEFGKYNSNMSLFKKEEIYELIKNFEIEGKTLDIIEKEFDGKTANGTAHH